jgi:hypothetical protein
VVAFLYQRADTSSGKNSQLVVPYDLALWMIGSNYRIHDLNELIMPVKNGKESAMLHQHFSISGNVNNALAWAANQFVRTPVVRGNIEIAFDFFDTDRYKMDLAKQGDDFNLLNQAKIPDYVDEAKSMKLLIDHYNKGR